MIAAKLYNKKFVYHILDYYADSHMFKNRMRRIVEYIEIKIINNSNSVIICSEQRKEQIKKSNPKSLYIIHNTPKPIKINTNSFYINNNNKCKIVYVGILGEKRFIMEIINFVTLYKDKFEFHIGGYGYLEEKISNISKCNDNVFYYGKLKYGDTLLLESECDIMTAIYDPDIPNHRYAAPNKFYEALMIGKPLIMIKNTGMDKYVKRYDIGKVAEYNFDSISQCFLEIANEKDKWNEIAMKERKLYESCYSWDIMDKRIKQLYSEL